MLIVRIWNFLLGYVIIKVEGLSLEKFINLSVSKGIYLWGIERVTYTTLKARVGIGGFRKLREVLRKVRCRVTIVDKRGLPFLMYRFRRRRMLTAGIFICLAIIYTLGSFVWIIDVEGTDRLDPGMITRKLEKNGIRPGIWKGKLDLSSLKEKMMMDVPELSWIGMEIKGIKFIARVVEAVEAPLLLDKDTPCNIIAQKDGIIAQMTILDGKSLVQIGDTVKKGQLLVSGIIEHENIGARYVHARGDVKARIWYEGRGKVSMNVPLKVRTGKKAVRKYIEAGQWRMKIQEDIIPFRFYEKVEKKEALLGKNLFFPASMVVEEYYELRQEKKSDNLNELRQAAQQEAMKEVEKIIPKDAKIVDKQIKFSMIKEESIEAIVYAETLESIGLQTPLSVNKEEPKLEQPNEGTQN